MISIPMHKMTLQEKLQAIDLLWSSISTETSEEISPAWHADELEKRLLQSSASNSVFEDWEAVKQELQELAH